MKAWWYIMIRMVFLSILALICTWTGLHADSYSMNLLHSIEELDKGSALQVLGIPVRYPLELSFSSHTEQYRAIFPADNTQFVFRSFSIISTKKEQVQVLESNSHFLDSSLDRNRPKRQETDLASGRLSPAINKAYGIAYQYSNIGVSMLLNFAALMGMDSSGHSLPEAYLAQLGIRYQIKPSIFAYRPMYAGLLVGFQQINMHQWETKLAKETEKAKSSFFTPGVTIGSKTFVLEGMVRLPITHYGNENDQFLKPELQGRLGLRWNLPEIIKP